MTDVKSVRFRQEQVSVFNGNNCPLSAGFSVRNHRNTHPKEVLSFCIVLKVDDRSAVQ